MVYVITNPCWDLSWTMLVKASPANYTKSVTAIVRDDAWNVYNLLFDDYEFWASSYFLFME